MQRLRGERLCQERVCPWPATLSLQGMRVQFHGNRAARQAGRAEGIGGAAVCHGECQFLLDRAASEGQRRGGAQMGSRRSEKAAGAGTIRSHCHRHARRNVAFSKKKTNKLWLWRAYDPVQQRTIAWVLGDRDDATCQRLLDKIGMAGRQFITDDWEGYHRLIPEDQLFTGKDLTFSIEQDNSNIRHFIARFRRRTKVVSKVEEMVDLSLRLYHFLHDNPKNFAALAFTFLSIFS